MNISGDKGGIFILWIIVTFFVMGLSSTVTMMISPEVLISYFWVYFIISSAISAALMTFVKQTE